MIIRQVTTSRDLAAFVDLPYRLHRNYATWIPPFKSEVNKLLDQKKNPFFQHAEADYFLAERDGRVVGRIAAIHNRLHNEIHQDRTGFFGFFESENDFRITQALTDRAAEWVRARGLDTLRGPMSFSVNDECGLLIDGFDTPNTLMMPHNPPWYLTLLETAGFTKAKDLICLEGGSLEGPLRPPERNTRAVELIKQRYGITIRSLSTRRFKQEVETVKKLYNQCWEQNWGYIPMTDAEIDALAEAFRPIVVPGIVPFIEKDGEPIGFALALPDLNEFLHRNRSGGMFPAALTMLIKLKLHRSTRARILLLGVLPEWRGKGIDAVLIHEVWKRAGEVGIGWGEAGWLLEDNAGIILGLTKAGFRDHYKTYRILDRPV